MGWTATPNNLFAFLFPWQRRRLAEQVGGEVARECRTAFWKRICPRISNMSVAEIRGYARALAEDFILEELDMALARRRLSVAFRGRALASGVDQLVALAIRDALSEEMPLAARPMAA
jgi:hypothetical protein